MKQTVPVRSEIPAAKHTRRRVHIQSIRHEIEVTAVVQMVPRSFGEVEKNDQ